MKSIIVAFSFAAAALAFPHIHNARHLAAAHKARDVLPPPTYDEGYLEPYLTYHIRYLAIDCEAKHNTTYFADCCHPLLATQSLAQDRKAYCAPSAAESSSAAAEVATAAPISGDGLSPVASPTVAPPAPVNVAPSPILSSAPAPPPPPPAPSTSAAPPPPPAPAPSTSAAPPPPPPPSPPPAPSPSAAPPSSGPTFADIIGEIFDGGIATYFWQNGVAGACGTVHADTDYIVALQTQTYANGAHCGKQILLSDETTGTQAVATVADECPTCDSSTCIDLSHSLFDVFAPDSQGQFNVKWGFIN